MRLTRRSIEITRRATGCCRAALRLKDEMSFGGVYRRFVRTCATVASRATRRLSISVFRKGVRSRAFENVDGIAAG
jgi:hypothetical protein